MLVVVGREIPCRTCLWDLELDLQNNAGRTSAYDVIMCDYVSP